MSRITYFLLAIFLTSPSVWADHPNVLFIAVDDLRPAIGCYGDELAITPNMDRLGGQGLIFNRAYCQVAVCNPSRASLMTGQRPDNLGVWTLPIHFRESKPQAVTMPQWFRKFGYTAVSHGKIYHNPTPDPQSWSEPVQPRPGLPFPYPEGTQEAIKAGKAKLPAGDWRKNNLRPPSTSATSLEDDELLDGFRTDKAIDDLKRLSQQDEPFFLAMGFVRPHLAWVAPKKYWAMHDPEALPVLEDEVINPNTPFYALHNNSELSHYLDLVDIPKPWDEETLPPEKARQLVHGYYACVSYIDAQIGRLLDALEASDAADNTIIVLWSDHGYKLGEYRGWGKMTNYEIDTRVPMMISTPAMRSGKSKIAGQTTESLAELLDLFPTLCDLADIETPDFVDGKTLVPVLEDPEIQIHDAALSQYYRQVNGEEFMGYAIRTNEHRFIEWRQFSTGEVTARELYDHRSDPGERNNLADSADPVLVDSLTDTLLATNPRKGLVMTPAIHSASGRDRAQVKMTFVNKSSSELIIVPVSSLGRRSKRVTRLKPRRKMTASTQVGNVFVVESSDGKVSEIHRVTEPEGRVVIGEESESEEAEPNKEADPAKVSSKVFPSKSAPKRLTVKLVAGPQGGLESIKVIEEKTFSAADMFQQLNRHIEQELAEVSEKDRENSVIELDVPPALKYEHAAKAIESLSGKVQDDGSLKKFFERVEFKEQ